MPTATAVMMNAEHNTRPSATAVEIPSDLAEVQPVHVAIESRLRDKGFTEKEIFGIRLALDEALVNAIKHGNGLDRSKKVQIVYSVEDGHFHIEITDEGPGFDPNEVPDPTDIENLERPCGRGLMLMRHYMTEVMYHGRGNSVSMSKLRNGKK